MPRVNLIQTKDDIAPEHHGLFDELAARRGRISGPSTVVLHSPGLARAWNEISEALHGLSVVEPQDAELAVCATARENDCAYIWAAHLPRAIEAGVSKAAINAVRTRASLDGVPGAEALVVHFVRQLLQDNRVDREVFDPLLKAHNPRWMVELTGWIGRYSALSGILNAFEVAPAAGADQLEMDLQPARGSKSSPGPPGATPRIDPITRREQVAEADRDVFDAVAEGRGNVRGPFSLLMYSPPLCQRILDLSNYLRFESELSPRLRELATIATAREKDCPYVWAAHAPAARGEGVPEALVQAVRDREDLGAFAPSDRDVVDYVRSVQRSHSVPQSLFDRLRDEHGVPRLVEITALMGHYVAVCALLNAVEVAPAAGAEQLPLS